MKRIFYLSLIAFAVITGCKDDPKPTPTNPCDGKTTFKANFDICEYLIDFDSLYVTDTIANFEVWIRTVGTYDSVKITVGNDARIFTSNKFKLEFNESESGQTIPVKMIGYKKTPSGCFTNEKTVDSLTKSFVVVCPKGGQCSTDRKSVV